MHEDSNTARLARVEGRLEHICSMVPEMRGEEPTYWDRSYPQLEVGFLISCLAQKKWSVFFVTFFFTTLAVFYALSKPNIYTASSILTASESSGGGMLQQLSSQYGGLAALAGINIGSGDSGDLVQALELVKSWPFLDSFVKRHSLKADIVAVKGWDAASNELIYDKKLYNSQQRKWTTENGSSLEPGSWDTFQALSENVGVSLDKKTNLVVVGVSHYSPEFSKHLLTLLIGDLNKHFQQRDIKLAKENIAYLEKKISETSVSEMQSMFYAMIESQMQTLMLAEVNSEYLLRTVVPAVTPERKSSPARLMICISGILLGGFLSVLYVFVAYQLKHRRESV